MDAYSKKFKCVLHFNSFEERVIMYDDMTYSTLLEFVVKRFNLDPNILFNLSFNLPAIERDITNDKDVEFFIDCATNSSINIRCCNHIPQPAPKSHYDNTTKSSRVIVQQAKMLKGKVFILDSDGDLMSTQKYMQKIIKDVGEDDDFNSEAWVSATNYVMAFGGTVTGCLGDIDNFLKKGKLDHIVAIVKSCSSNMLGDLNVTLKDIIKYNT
ncbi:hypothetical protein Tco_0526868 [Tanacetum coccineum]